MCAGVLVCVCVHACVFVDVYEREKGSGGGETA